MTTLADLFATDDTIDALYTALQDQRGHRTELPVNATHTASLELAIGCPLGGNPVGGDR